MRFGRVSFAVAALAVVMGSAFGGIASALNNPDDMMPTATRPNGCSAGSLGSANPCQTDNRTLTYFMTTSIPQGANNTIQLVLNDMYAKTVLVPTYQSPPVYSGSSETDVVYQQGTVPGSDTGYTWCDDPSGTYSCDQQYIQIESGGWQKGVTCHETGHAVGLLHGEFSSPVVANNNAILKCMEKPTPSDDNLGDNNKDNINNTY